MTKKKYLRKLRKALGRISESEKEEIVEYYAELIDESYERGKTTREIFATLETPEQAASDYFNATEGSIRDRRRPRRDEYFSRGRDDDYDGRRDDDYDYGRRREPREYRPRPSAKSEKHKPNVLATVLLFPLWFPIFLVAFILALAVSIMVIALLIADVVLVVGLSVGGLYSLVMSFGLFPSNAMIAVTQIGVAAMLFGIAMLFELTIKPLGRGVGAFFRLLFRKEGGHSGAVAQSNWVATMAVGIVLIMVGAGMGAFGFSSLDWNWKNLAVVGDFTQKEQIIELPSESFAFSTDNLRVEVVPSEDETAKIVYYESEDLAMQYSYENGVVSLKNGEWSTNFGEYLKQVWHRGIAFSAVTSAYIRATLYLPQSYTGDLSLKANNGALTLGGFGESKAFGKVELTTDNGMIAVEGLNAQSVTVDTDNGYIKLNGVYAEKVDCKADNGAVDLLEVKAGVVSGLTHNGAIRCSKVESDDITLTVNNGAISGTLVGSRDDFRIAVHVGNGRCNLSEKTDGSKSLFAKTGNGSIELEFV